MPWIRSFRHLGLWVAFTEVLQTLVLQAHTKCGECGGHLTRSICDDCGTKHSGWDRYPSVTDDGKIAP